MEGSVKFEARSAARRGMAAAEQALAVGVALLMAAVSFATRHRAGLVSVLAVVIFYTPAFLKGSDLVMGGDTLGWYLPALAKTHALIHALDFTALDYSSFNGSSDFFLSPNFFPFHPLVVLFSLFAPASAASAAGLGIFITALLAFHSFLALYFSIQLFTRFFALEFSAAAFAGVVFAFSAHMLNARYSPPFFLSATIVPWVVYASLSFASLPTLRGLLFAALPVLFGFTAGYLPLSVACLALSAVIVAARLLACDTDLTEEQRLRRLLLAGAPFVLAALVVSFYLYAVYAFHQETTSSGVPSLFYSAHQLAELPQSLLRVFSLHFAVPGPMYEFSLSWGMVAVIVAATFVFAPAAFTSVPAFDWRVLMIAAAIYFLTVLAIFGQFSPVSDMVFYYVPQVGKMHIYQRFLLPAHLLFALMLALMLRALIDARPVVATRIAMAVLAAATIAAAYAVAWHPQASQAAGINNYVVFELGLGFLFALALAVPSRAFVFGAAAVLASLPMLDRMYDGSLPHAVYENQKTDRVALDPRLRAGFVSWMKGRFPDRDVIKYVDITPMWTKRGVETFPKVFPFFVLQEVRLSSYGGFTFYLSSRADYMKRMPVQADVQVVPDWDYVTKSGADFVVARSTDLEGPLANLAAGLDKGDLYRLPNEVVVVPIRPQGAARMAPDSSRYDNGFFRISTGTAAAPPRRHNLAVGKSARQSGEAGGKAALAVDGNTNGDFAAGSVSHTNRDQNAWIEIDLGAVEQVDAVKIWNRTDAGSERLRDYWVFISENAFSPADTAGKLRGRKDVWARQHVTPRPSTTLDTGRVRGRYVRLQFDGRQPLEESYLSIAEIEVLRDDETQEAAAAKTPPGTVKVIEFSTDFAQWADLEFEATSPSTVEYLFWDNPRLAYYVDGKRVTPQKEGGPVSFHLPAGRHTVELRYRHWPLKIFWLMSAAYGIGLLLALVWPFRGRFRRPDQPSEATTSP